LTFESLWGNVWYVKLVLKAGHPVDWGKGRIVTSDELAEEGYAIDEHPVALAMPRPSPEEEQELRDSLVIYEQIQPILLTLDKPAGKAWIVDGITRNRILKAVWKGGSAGSLVKYKVVPEEAVDGSEGRTVADLVIALNIKRRNLAAKARAKAVAAVLLAQEKFKPEAVAARVQEGRVEGGKKGGGGRPEKQVLSTIDSTYPKPTRTSALRDEVMAAAGVSSGTAAQANADARAEQAGNPAPRKPRTPRTPEQIIKAFSRTLSKLVEVTPKSKRDDIADALHALVDKLFGKHKN